MPSDDTIDRLYREQSEAVRLNGRFAAFTNDELTIIIEDLGNSVRADAMLDEVSAELERRRA